MRKVFKRMMVVALVVLLASCGNSGTSGYTLKEVYGTDDPEAARMLSRASHRDMKIKDVRGELCLGGVGGPTVDGKHYANSSEPVAEGQYAFYYYNEEKDRYYLILVGDNDSHDALEQWCMENLK